MEPQLHDGFENWERRISLWKMRRGAQGYDTQEYSTTFAF